MTNQNLVKPVVVQQVFAGNPLDIQVKTVKAKHRIVTFSTLLGFTPVSYIQVFLFKLYSGREGESHLVPDCLIKRATSAGSRWKTIRPLILVPVEIRVVNKAGREGRAPGDEVL